MNKKGFKLISIIVFAGVIIVAAVIWLILFKGGTVRIGDILASQIDAVGDCDQDGFPNSGFANTKDQCPCIDAGGKGSDKFKGCPAGTTREEANIDMKTCGKYWSATNPDPKKMYANEEECEDKLEGNCNQKCDTVEAVAQATGSTTNLVIKGRECNCDIVLERFVVTDGGTNTATSTPNNEAVLRKDLANTEAANLEINWQMSTTGDDFTETVKAVISICDGNKLSSNCKQYTKAVFVGSKEISKSPPINIPVGVGYDLDFCDGPGTMSCYLKFAVDHGSNGILKEGLVGETNNVAFVEIVLDKQEYDKSDEFDSKRSINLAADETDNLPRIVNTCKEFFGEECPATKKNYISNDCNHEDPTIGEDAKTFYKNHQNLKNLPVGCWITIEEFDGDVPGDLVDCASAIATPGAVVSKNPALIDWFKNVGLGGSDPETDEDSPGSLLEQPWSAPLNLGSLLCNEGSGYAGTTWYWEVCNENAEGMISLVTAYEEFPERKFRCERGFWKKLR